jgi:hypothetical protein
MATENLNSVLNSLLVPETCMTRIVQKNVSPITALLSDWVLTPNESKILEHEIEQTICVFLNKNQNTLEKVKTFSETLTDKTLVERKQYCDIQIKRIELEEGKDHSHEKLKHLYFLYTKEALCFEFGCGVYKNINRAMELLEKSQDILKQHNRLQQSLWGMDDPIFNGNSKIIMRIFKTYPNHFTEEYMCKILSESLLMDADTFESKLFVKQCLEKDLDYICFPSFVSLLELRYPDNNTNANEVKKKFFYLYFDFLGMTTSSKYWTQYLQHTKNLKYHQSVIHLFVEYIEFLLKGTTNTTGLIIDVIPLIQKVISSCTNKESLKLLGELFVKSLSL